MSQGQLLSSKRPRTNAAVSPSTPTPGGMDHLSSPPRRDARERSSVAFRLKTPLRTSGLANSWRYRWARCPGLKLVFGEDDSTTAAAVDAFLARYTCNVSHAQIELGDEPHTIDIDGWLRALAAKAIRYLVLRFMPSDSSLLRIMPLAPASLFSCSQLTSLVLERCNIPALPPSFNGFPTLRRSSWMLSTSRRMGRRHLRH
ncbi:hypothetical protein HU200_066160 [Digitaria exilis]|uniref:F-box/LRR-repeat protein 15/At3g58940/PEG3-like LRR domain-containing protein n=1 Tax=Digitaria exilis TaxID=1010633 RepID=A0A834ZX17_9POAL|nr:hypothetical protein HU200_066160 [Digitaria exilis]